MKELKIWEQWIVCERLSHVVDESFTNGLNWKTANLTTLNFSWTAELFFERIRKITIQKKWIVRERLSHILNESFTNDLICTYEQSLRSIIFENENKLDSVVRERSNMCFLIKWFANDWIISFIQHVKIMLE